MLNKHLSKHSFSYINASKNFVSQIFCLLFCFFSFQGFLNISTACLISKQNIVFGVKKVFKKSNRGWACIVLLFRLLKTYLDFQNFSYLDFIDFCRV